MVFRTRTACSDGMLYRTETSSWEISPSDDGTLDTSLSSWVLMSQVSIQLNSGMYQCQPGTSGSSLMLPKSARTPTCPSSIMVMPQPEANSPADITSGTTQFTRRISSPPQEQFATGQDGPLFPFNR